MLVIIISFLLTLRLSCFSVVYFVVLNNICILLTDIVPTTTLIPFCYTTAPHLIHELS